MNRKTAALIAIVVGLAFSRPGLCGGAWVPEPGQGDVQVGFSRKTATSSWDAGGDAFRNTTVHEGEVVSHHHDFRYGYLAGEVGVMRNLSFTFLGTYLYGLEGALDDLEKNAGPSDAWFGLKYGLRQGDLPMAVAFTYRTPYFYDIDGAYNRHLFNADGSFRGVSPEWRGLLKEDYTLSYLVSRSLRGGGGWWNAQVGYTWRTGAPADEVPVVLDLGYPLPFAGMSVKGAVVYVHSLGNDSPRQPDDRFGSRPGFNFNDASMGRAGVSLIVPVGPQRRWNVEAGYNRWLWGESARRYEEPFLSVNRRF